MLEPRQEPVELVLLQVELGQLADDVELMIQVLGSIEGPPVDLDRFLGLVLAGQSVGQSEDDLGVVGVGPDSPSQGVEPFFRSTELETKLSEKLIVVGLPGAAASRSRPALRAASVRPSRDSILAMPVKCSVRLRRSISASRRKASAESPRLPADSRTRAAKVQARIERGSSCDRPVGGPNRLGQLGMSASR